MERFFSRALAFAIFMLAISVPILVRNKKTMIAPYLLWFYLPVHAPALMTVWVPDNGDFMGVNFGPNFGVKLTILYTIRNISICRRARGPLCTYHQKSPLHYSRHLHLPARQRSALHIPSKKGICQGWLETVSILPVCDYRTQTPQTPSPWLF